MSDETVTLMHMFLLRHLPAQKDCGNRPSLQDNPENILKGT